MNQLDKTSTELKFWPTPQDYNEAVQNLAANCKDAELQKGSVEHNNLGLPVPRSGSFASVYKVTVGGKNSAIRCFLRELDDTEERYRCISQFVQHDDLPYTVGFDFQRDGLRVGARWVPLLKMEWVEGETLDNYLNKRNGHISDKLAAKFLEMCERLHAAGIAHGDLQHGNIIIKDEELYLVDYDGMFVPGLKNYQSTEIGHRNYQHPKRDGSTFGPQLDNFSAWVIYASLRALASNPNLYDDLGAGSDCLLFRKTDFDDPNHSPAFAALERSADREIAALALQIRYALLKQTPDMVPPLSASPAKVPALPPIGPDVLARRTITKLVTDPAPTTSLDSPAAWSSHGVLKTSAQVGLERAAAMTGSSSFYPPRVGKANAGAAPGTRTQTLVTTGSIEPELLQARPRKIVSPDRKPLSAVRMLGLAIALPVLSACLALSLLVISPALMMIAWLVAIVVSLKMMHNTFFKESQLRSIEGADLLKDGTPTRAKIVKISPNDKGYFLVYQFFDVLRNQIVEHSVTVTESDLTKIGNEVTVLYNSKANTSLIYGLAKAKVAL